MYRDDDANRFLEVTYQNGDKEILYYKDFASGAMIENIVRRAKKLAIKRVIGGGSKGVCTQDLLDSIKQEYKEHEDLPNTTNPDDWAKISGKKGERIVFIRTLVAETTEDDEAVRPKRSNGCRPASTLYRSPYPVVHRPDRLRPWRCRRSVGSRPSTASSCAGATTTRSRRLRLLINAYVSSTARERGRIGWDFEDEHPANDARGFSLDDTLAPEVETTLVNAVLTNGARYYVDHAHPEISLPEVTTAREAVVWDRGRRGDRARLDGYARAFLDGGSEIVVHKNNSDGKGNSYGCHENYLMARAVPFGRFASQITPHFVTRQIFCGAGKVGCEIPGRPHDDVRTSSVSGPTSSRRRSGSRRRSSGRSSTPATSRTPTPRSTDGCTSSSATPT